MENSALIVASVASMIDQFNMPNIELLIEMGFKVSVACNFIDGNTITNERVLALRKRLDQLGVQQYQIHFSRNILNIIQNTKAFIELYKVTLKDDFNFIHCHSPIGGVVSRLVGKLRNIKVVYTAHGFHFYKGASFLSWCLYYPIELFLSRFTDVLITINKEDYNLALSKFKKCNVVYFEGVGINLNKFNVTSDSKKERSSMGFKDDDVLIISVGELSKRKNHRIIIESLAKINNKNVHYIICGKGILSESLILLAKKLHLEQNVHLLGYRSDVKDLYLMADIFAFPSFQEGLPVSIMEAMASGLPVVCSNIRGNTDLIEDNFNGYIVNRNNSDDYASQIRKLILNKRERKTFGERSIKKINNFSIDKVLLKSEKVYERYKK